MKIREILNEDKSVANLNLNYKGGDLDLLDKNLTSLKGSPQNITGNFICSGNKLKNLIGGPKIIKYSYQCDFNPMTSLEGSPEEITNGVFSCSVGNLKNLKFAPKIINGSFWCEHNKISSFKKVFEHIHEINGTFYCIGNLIKEGLLHILLIKGVEEIQSPFNSIDDIINNYLKTHNSGTPKAMFDVQKLIIEAKLKDVPESIYME